MTDASEPARTGHVPSPPGRRARRPIKTQGLAARARRLAWCGVLVLAVPAAAGATPRLAIPPQVQRQLSPCLAEALRLCPNALAAKDHGLSCILGQRRMLSASCRPIYDLGLRLLNGQDLHLTLRPSRPR